MSSNHDILRRSLRCDDNIAHDALDAYGDELDKLQGNTITDGDVTYTPWTDGNVVGFKCTHTDGRVEFVYFNPSATDKDGQPNVFVYHGATGDPGEDSPVVYVNVLEADGYEIVEAVGGAFIVTYKGFQVGGHIDASGAGNRTFATKDLARAFISARRGD